MKKITIYLKDGSPERISIDGKPVPIDAFFLTTSVPKSGAGHFLCYGNSDSVGKMLFSFWKCSLSESPEMAETMEMVAEDILDASQKEKGSLYKEMSGKGTTH